MTKTLKGFNKPLTAIFEKEMNGKELTEKQQKTLDIYINDVGGYREEEKAADTVENTDLLNLLDETPTDDETPNNEETPNDETPNGDNNPAENNNQKVLDLTSLTEIENQYNNLSKHQKLRTASDSNIELQEKLKELGIYGIFTGKKAPNDIGTHFINYALPTLDGMEYNAAYKKLSLLYRKNPLFAKNLADNAQGEIITIAGYGGLFLNFIRPYGDTLTINGANGEPLTITQDTWANEPLAAWSNGGRMTKVFNTLGMINYLDGDYNRKPTDKFQLERRDIRTRHFLHFEKRGETVGMITRNGNFKPIPENIQGGWKNLIEWGQAAI